MRLHPHVGVGPLLATLLVLPVGCGGQTPEPVAPVATVAPVVAPPPPAVDLTPVPEPQDIVAVARWKNPNATIAGLSTCAGVPESLADGEVKRLLDRALGRAFRGGVDGKQIADGIALDAPVDLVVTLDAEKRGKPGGLFAFSVGLSSLERAKTTMEAAGALVELQPGFWRVGVKDEGDMTCVIGPAAGTAPARLICGPHDRDVSALAPYLARNLPVAPAPAQDIHAELRFTPVDARYGSDLRRALEALPGLARMQEIGDPKFDRALADAAQAVSGEGQALLSDLDRVSLDFTVDGNACLTTQASLKLRGQSSWLVSTMMNQADRAGPPPAIYWHAPVDSASASYGRAVDGARYAPILKTLRALLEGKLAQQKIGSDADRKALGNLLTVPVGKDTSYVVASGTGGPVKLQPANGKVTQEQINDMVTQSYLGWTLIGFDEGPAALSKLIKDAVGAYGRKGLIDPLRKLLGKRGDDLPTAKLVPAPAQLGGGALDVEIKVELPKKHDYDAKPEAKKDAKKKGPAITFHVLLMGEPKATWIAFGANRDELVKRLLAAKSGAPESGTLAARPGLEPLRAGKALGSGFLTLGVVTQSLTNLLNGPLVPASAGAVVADMKKTLNNLPHDGKTPIFITSTVAPAEGGPRSDLVLHVQRGSLEDFGAILLTIHRIATNLGVRP